MVWEESIIMLPDQCQYAFLSATIPNAHEFAQWVATTHKKKCHVVYTDFRPVPLQHYIMPCGAATPSLFCVVRRCYFVVDVCSTHLLSCSRGVAE